MPAVIDDDWECGMVEIFWKRARTLKRRQIGFLADWTKEKKMPHVGKKDFPYTKAGKAAAKKAMAAKKMSPAQMKKKMKEAR